MCREAVEVAQRCGYRRSNQMDPASAEEALLEVGQAVVERVEFVMVKPVLACFFFSSGRRHTSWSRDWSSDVCSSDLSPRPNASAAVLVAATRTAAEALGLGEHIGTVAEGKLADLIVVDGDPLTEPRLLSDPGRIWLVLQLGVPVAGQALTGQAMTGHALTSHAPAS